MNCRVVKIAIAFCAVVLFSSISGYAQDDSRVVVETKIYFRYDKAYIDSTYMGNKQSLYQIDSLLKDSLYISTLRKIDVSAQSSIEGAVGYNRALSERRRSSLKRYFTANYQQIDSSLWSFNAVAENWELFTQQLQEDRDLPDREQILAICASDRAADDKEWLLRILNGGKSWQYIADNILPSQRFGASVLFTPFVPSLMIEPTIFKSQLAIDSLYIPPYQSPCEEGPKLLCALKTNLILDLCSAVNIAAEVPIGSRLSVVGEVVFPWWRSWPKNFTMQVQSYHAEVKYWLGDRATKDQLQGWSVGLYGGFGLYDIQPFSEDGVQGDFFDVGAQVTYAHPITKSRKLYLEYALGLGYLSTDYSDYYMAYDTKEYGDIKVVPYPWMNSSLRAVLPTRLGVSLVWHIESKAKGGNR